MLSRYTHIFITTLLTLFVCCPLRGEALIDWSSNFSSALKQSQQEKRPLLLYFSASDTSGWCMKMEREVLHTKEFATIIAPQFICVQIDFSQSAPDDKELQKQNEQLKEELGVKDFPRIVLMQGDRRVFLKSGYLACGPTSYADFLVSSAKEDQFLSKLLEKEELVSFSEKELIKHYSKAKELFREDVAHALLERGLAKGGSSFFMLEKYKLLVEAHGTKHEEAQALKAELLSMDPLKEQAMAFSLAMIDFQELSKTTSSIKAIAPLVEYLKRFGDNDTENGWQVEMMIAQAYLASEHSLEALKHAQVALERAPEARKTDIEKSITYIQKECR